MKVTKDTLQLFCKTLGVSATGNKTELSARICGELCGSGKMTSVAKTVKGLLRSGNKKELKSVLQLVVDLNDEDVDIGSIVKQVKSKFNIKIDRSDINAFLDVLDAEKKKDHALLDEMGEEKKYGIGFKMAAVLSSS